MVDGRIDFRIEELDRLLDELEHLAQSDIPRSKYYFTVLDRLRFVLQAQGVAYAVPLEDQNWGAVATCGTIDTSRVLAEWQSSTKLDQSSNHCPSRVSNGRQAGDLDQSSGFYRTNAHSLLQTIGTNRTAKQGALLVQFSDHVPETALEELPPLMQAFAELIRLRQTSDLETFLFQKWPAFHQVIASLPNTRSIDEAATIVVNDLRGLVGADRISWVQQTRLDSPRLVCVSGVVEIEKNAQNVQAMEKVGGQVIRSGKPIVRSSGPNMRNPANREEGIPELFPNYLCFPIGKSKSVSGGFADSAILCEWENYEDLLNQTLTIHSLVSVLDWVWSAWMVRTSRPSLANRINFWRGDPSGGRFSKKIVLKTIILVMLFSGFAALFVPIPFRISMTGSLEPESQRIVYAAMDGVVERVLVEDNALVERGQMLVNMSSPSLELQIQEVIGELNGNAEKRDALSLSLNQLAQQGASNPSVLNRISSEIRQLDTLAEMLRAKLNSLQTEKARLDLVAPMEGIVIARDLDQLLDSRPLRRGDALFRIVDPAGSWRMHLSIADADAGYVLEQLSSKKNYKLQQTSQFAPHALKFTIVSKPDKSFSGNFVWLSNSARNPAGSGVYIDAIADIDSSALEHAYIGATVEAWLDCGRKPLWFVFSRPLVETIQRKLWF